MSVIKNEIEKFTNIATPWWDLSGPFKPLHQITPPRLEYIKHQIQKNFNTDFSKLKILDVGCGGGLLSIPLAKLGCKVTAIDPGIENIEAGKSRSNNLKIDVNFEAITIQEFNKKGQKFDVVICSEVLEHVQDYALFINEISKFLNKDGIAIFSTINRNLKSNILAIYLAEYILNIVPKGTHEFYKFIKPSEMILASQKSGLKFLDLSGISFSLLKREWILSKDTDINYIASFKL